MLTVSFPSVSSIQNKRKEYHSYINIFAFAVCSTYICKSLPEQRCIPLIHKTLSSEKSVPQHVLWPVCEQATNAPQKICGHLPNIAIVNTRILQQQLGTTKPKSNSQYIYVCPWDITWYLNFKLWPTKVDSPTRNVNMMIERCTTVVKWLFNADL